MSIIEQLLLSLGHLLPNFLLQFAIMAVNCHFQILQVLPNELHFSFKFPLRRLRIKICTCIGKVNFVVVHYGSRTGGTACEVLWLHFKKGRVSDERENKCELGSCNIEGATVIEEHSVELLLPALNAARRQAYAIKLGSGFSPPS